LLKLFNYSYNIAKIKIKKSRPKEQLLKKHI